MTNLPKTTRLTDAFDMANQALAHMVTAIVSMIDEVGLINIDLADLKMALSQPGFALVGKGLVDEHNNICTLIETSRLLSNELDLNQTQVAIVIVSAPTSMSLQEYDRTGNELRDALHNNAAIISGLNYNRGDDELTEVFLLLCGVTITYS